MMLLLIILVITTLVTKCTAIANNKYAIQPGSIMTPKVSSRSEALTTFQKRAATIVSTFTRNEEFHPKIADGHVQSILGFFLRETCSYVPRNESPISFFRRIQSGFESMSSERDNAAFWDARERIDTPDGDWFHVDYKYANGDPAATMTNSVPTVLLLHGLQSSSYGNLAVEMARAYELSGLNVIAINFRGCSKDENGQTIPNDTLGAYHLGFTKDLLHFIGILKERYPTTHLYLSGFSLGANVVLKCLGDLKEDAIEYNIHGAAVICAPLDQEKNSPVLARPLSIQRFVYSSGLLKSLKQMAQLQLDRLQAHDKVSLERIQQAKTIAEFDDAFIAPIYDFTDCWDYYRQTSSIHVLETIAVPTLIFNARDDPFFDNSVWPTDVSFENGGHAPLKMIRSGSGGHLGFVFHEVDENDERLRNKTPSFGSHTAANFIEHVRTYTKDNTETV